MTPNRALLALVLVVSLGGCGGGETISGMPPSDASSPMVDTAKATDAPGIVTDGPVPVADSGALAADGPAADSGALAADGPATDSPIIDAAEDSFAAADKVVADWADARVEDALEDAPETITPIPANYYPCSTSTDCCVMFNSCKDLAFLYSVAPGASPMPTMPPPTGCPDCVAPSIQLSCLDGQCVGQKAASTYAVLLRRSHCGTVNLPDAGTPDAGLPDGGSADSGVLKLHAAGDVNLDASTALTTTAWTCGS